jgi:hypothetical protein
VALPDSRAPLAGSRDNLAPVAHRSSPVALHPIRPAARRPADRPVVPIHRVERLPAAPIPPVVDLPADPIPPAVDLPADRPVVPIHQVERPRGGPILRVARLRRRAAPTPAVHHQAVHHQAAHHQATHHQADPNQAAHHQAVRRQAVHHQAVHHQADPSRPAARLRADPSRPAVRHQEEAHVHQGAVRTRVLVQSPSFDAPSWLSDLPTNRESKPERVSNRWSHREARIGKERDELHFRSDALSGAARRQ